METTTVETPDGLTLAVARHTADGDPRGTVLLAHGLAQDMDEGGMYVRLAGRLVDAGFNVVRFSYRGHGASDGSDRGMTVAGELLDLAAVFEHTTARFEGPYAWVAKSFGGVSACCSLDRFADALAGLVLWNPVLDIEATFLDPALEWGRENFTGEQLTDLREQGHLTVDGRFRLGRVCYGELDRYDPAARLRAHDLPTLVVHGDADRIVPYDATRQAAEAAGAAFHTVADADHGFVRADETPPFTADAREQDRRTVAWLAELIEA